VLKGVRDLVYKIMGHFVSNVHVYGVVEISCHAVSLSSRGHAPFVLSGMSSGSVLLSVVGEMLVRLV
jgi:hypothetical protein